MYTFLGNEDQWEAMMLQEGRLEELGLNATSNITNSTAASQNATSCVGDVCSAMWNDTITAAVHDEF
jgi:hypothetical protein